MSRKREYDIITERLPYIVDKINEYLRQGWELHGTLMITGRQVCIGYNSTEGIYKPEFCQPMVRTIIEGE